MIGFLYPWVLTGLIVLPILWWILRFLPPLPKKIFLPTTRFLLDLKNTETTPDTAPWWLILLRLLILACLIIGFAGPVLNPKTIAPSSGPLRLVFDNGWASAQTWQLQMAKAEEILQAAGQSNRPVQLQFTASNNTLAFNRADQVLSQLKSAEPVSWPGLPERLKADTKAETIWISSGLAETGFEKAAQNFADAGGLTIFLPDMKFRPAILRGKSETPKSLIRVEIPTGSGERNITAQAFDPKFKLVGQLNQNISGQSGGQDILDDTDFYTDKKIAQWKTPSISGAGGIYQNDITTGSGTICVVAKEKEASQADFSDAAFYISRAAEAFAKIETGLVEDLIKKSCGVIVLPDIASFSPDTLNALQTWLKKGGVLLRFGGKSMSEAENVLIPVALKTGLRSLSGDMSWTSALKLASFPKNSPLAGEKIPDITVERQLLAEPSADLQDHAWASLSDGTPFITAKPEGRGLLILVHTTATPDWSDFVLSGFYVNFLQKVTKLSALPDKSKSQSASLEPLLVFNGWGQLVKPDSNVKPIARAELEDIEISKDHPPGLYGDTDHKFPVNLGDHIPNLSLIDHLPDGATSQSLSILSQEKKLASIFFAMSAFLFLLDWLLLILSSNWGKSLTVILLLLSFPVKAETDIDRAATIHLACVKTSQDALCQTALYKVSNILKARTSVEIGAPVIIDLETDDLSFYPLLYWPVDTQQNLTSLARSNLARYIGKGGMVLIDTQDGAYETGQIVPSPAVMHLRGTLQGIDIPPLKPAPKDFVMFKSFYLLNIRPEYDLTGKFWVEDDSIAPEEGLSSVMITGEDWLHRWAYPEDPVAEEMSYRFGINLAIYALTGNYKTDQIHMKAILERMGQ